MEQPQRPEISSKINPLWTAFHLLPVFHLKTGMKVQENWKRGWGGLEGLEEFEERAAIREHDGGMSRADAERLTHADRAGSYARRNPKR